MAGLEKNRWVASSRRVYETLLAAYPKRFRDRYGQEMADLFEEVCLEELERGGKKSLLWFLVKATADLVAGVLAERGRFMVGISMVKWCGLLTIIAGFAILVSGLLAPRYYLYPGSGGYFSGIVWPVGSLLRVFGIAGLVCLIAANGVPGEAAYRRMSGVGDRLAGIRRIGVAEASALAGLFFAVVAISANFIVTAVMFLSGGIAIGGPDGVPADSVLLDVFFLLGFVSFYGVPAAIFLLGFAIWRSEILHKSSYVPMVIGFLLFPASFISTAAYTAMRELSSNGMLLYTNFPVMLRLYAEVSAQEIVIGIGWIVLGFILLRYGRSHESIRRPAASV